MTLAIDLETTGLDVQTCDILGIALSIKEKEAYYLKFSRENSVYNESLKTHLKSLLEDNNFILVGHNLKYDLQVLKNKGYKINCKIYDTMVADYILFPNRKKHGLKLISKLHLNYKQIEFNEIAIVDFEGNKTLEGVDIKMLTNYACEDVDLTLQLFNYLFKQIKNQNLESIFEMDCELVKVLVDIEINGVSIDKTLLKTIEEELTTQISKVKDDIFEISNKTFKINSNNQLNNVLFEDLKLIPVGKKGKNKLYSLSSINLQKMSVQHPIVEKIIEYRAIEKVISTFIPALQKTNTITGKIHASFSQTSTETGRISCSNPNLQNIPSRTIGNKIRAVFVPSSNNHVLIGVDYSNIELRLMAIISMDEVMITSYKNNIDLHTLTASKIFNIAFDTVSKEQRNVGKTVNFGLIYGMTSVGLQQNLYKNTGKEYTIEFCNQIIYDYFDLYKGVAQCRENLVYKATINGYTETLFGRKRPLPNINSNNSKLRNLSKRLAMNTPIQGSAADIIKLAMINIHKRIINEGLQTKMMLQVHDELLFDTPLNEVNEVSKLIKFEMENVVTLAIPLEVDLKIGKNWAEVH